MKNFKKLSNLISAFVLCVVIFTSNVAALRADNTTNSDKTQGNIYIPLWMQPNTVIVYNASLRYEISQGGELTADDIIGRDDISVMGLTSTEQEMIAQPNIKVEYDLHGFIQNIYYPDPFNPRSYQLSNPVKSKVTNKILDDGESVTYGSYINYDYSGRKDSCTLKRIGNTITGTGRITFFTGTTGSAGTTLKAYDCATQMDYCNVKSGTSVTATNIFKNKKQTYKKYDVGSLPSAILDIWSDSTVNPITDITNNGTVDNVYTAAISLTVS